MAGIQSPSTGPLWFLTPSLLLAHLTSDYSSGMMCHQVSSPLPRNSSGSSFWNKCALAGYPCWNTVFCIISFGSYQHGVWSQTDLSSNSQSASYSPCDFAFFNERFCGFTFPSAKQGQGFLHRKEAVKNQGGDGFKVKCPMQILSDTSLLRSLHSLIHSACGLYFCFGSYLLFFLIIYAQIHLLN